jgi:hypothetical protein
MMPFDNCLDISLIDDRGYKKVVRDDGRNLRKLV